MPMPMPRRCTFRCAITAHAYECGLPISVTNALADVLRDARTGAPAVALTVAHDRVYVVARANGLTVAHADACTVAP